MSTDDLAIRAGKERLTRIADQPGFADAMQLPPPGTRTTQFIWLAITMVLAGVTIWQWNATESGALRTTVFVALLAMTMLALAFTAAAAPLTPTAAWPAAVVAIGNRLTVLRDDGTTHELACPAVVAHVLRVGDVGVARVRDGELVELIRL